ncbi:MAG: isoprenoid biosynthesis glyoxalase ElbB [Candidatus Delongbacteria bacterium]|nr:isoprenoid biosynthesis glyoxalase ElbB [Candidatus Delongbacteria bacterium]MBN2836567.1 isoprenoid biosynthesis glyoxalase ElbB [Candidatus Delongbacteria bacterium]
MKKIAVVLGGCGHLDGSEIQESVSTLLALSKFRAEVKCFAVDEVQKDNMNHLTRTGTDEKRNLLIEAARIARGNIAKLQELKAEDYDAVIFPGGFGIAKNYMNYAFVARDAIVRDDIKNVVLSFNKLEKYIGAICISPTMMALAFRNSGKKVKLTAGLADIPNQDLEYFGALSEKRKSDEICIDTINKLVSTPAYMNEASLIEVYTGIEKLVKHIVENC